MTDELAITILREYKPHVMTRKMLAAKYRVRFGTVCNLIHGQNWRHLK